MGSYLKRVPTLPIYQRGKRACNFQRHYFRSNNFHRGTTQTKSKKRKKTSEEEPEAAAKKVKKSKKERKTEKKKKKFEVALGS